MQRVVGLAFFWGILFFVGCSRPPEIPVLDNSKADTYPEIALRDSLSPADFRNIFEALNQKGHLSGFKTWLRTTSDADLNILGKSINKFIYQDAFEQNGLPSLLETRIGKKGFTQLNKKLKIIAQDFPDFSFAQFLKSILNQPSTPKILVRGSFVFEPQWNQNFQYFEILNFFQSPKTSEIEGTLVDMKRLLELPNFKNEFIELCQTLRNSEIGKNFFISLQSLREIYGESLYSDLGGLISKGLQLTENSNSVITRLLKLVKILNQPSGGLFSEAQKTLKTEEGEALVRLLSERFEPIILKAATGFIRETLQEPFDEINLNANFWKELPRKNIEDIPTKNFIHLLRRLQFALDKMANSSHSSKDPHVTLNSFLLTRWFEEMAKVNSQQLMALAPDNFHEVFWQMSVQPFTFALNLLELDEKGKPIKDPNGGYILSHRIENELRTIGMEEFANDLRWVVKQDSFGPTSTKIGLSGTEINLIGSLKTVITLLHKAHPIADPVPLLSSVAYLFTRPMEGSSITLAELESPNMLDSLQNLARGLSFYQVRKIITFLFRDLDLGNLSVEDREKLRTLYPNNPTTADLLDSVLQNLQIIYDLDRHSPGGVSLLELYHAILTNSRFKDVKSLSKLLMFFESSGLFGATNSKNNYPYIVKNLSNQSDLSKLISLFGNANSAQINSLLRIMQFVGGERDSDVKDLLSFSRDIIFSNPKTASTILSIIQDENETFNLSEPEKLWLHQFINGNSFSDLYRILVTNNQSENLYKVMDELKKLQENKELEGLIRVLGNIKSDRMQRLALILWKWEKSQELDDFFELVKSLTKSLNLGG